MIRHDELFVFDDEGNVLKSFNLKKHLDSLPKKPKPNKIISREHDTFEYSHFNSISETYSLKDGKKEFTGYVTYDVNSKTIYFLDKDLSSITSTVATDSRALHDIAQISENEFIFYRNEQRDPSDSFGAFQFSQIEIFDQKENKFRTLYNNQNVELVSKICSSVQYLPSDELLIFHSACPAPLNPPERHPHIEAVNLKNGRNFVLRVDGFKESIEAKLINAEDFLKKTNGR